MEQDLSKEESLPKDASLVLVCFLYAGTSRHLE